MTRKSIAVLALILGLAASEAALACSCAPPPPPQQALEGADAVFAARVLEAPEGADTGMKLQVQDSWKGAECGELEIGAGFATCMGTFEKGKTYLIYAYRTKEGGLSTNLCTRTVAIEHAAEDLAALGNPEKSCG